MKITVPLTISRKTGVRSVVTTSSTTVVRCGFYNVSVVRTVDRVFKTLKVNS